MAAPDTPREYHPVARADGVHVLNDMCETCVFKPGDRMNLEPGRLRGMIQGALKDESCIPCHSTIRRDDTAPAICHGFWRRYAHRVVTLRLAVFLKCVVFEPPPPKGRL